MTVYILCDDIIINYVYEIFHENIIDIQYCLNNMYETFIKCIETHYHKNLHEHAVILYNKYIDIHNSLKEDIWYILNDIINKLYMNYTDIYKYNTINTNYIANMISYTIQVHEHKLYQEIQVFKLLCPE